MNTLAQTPQNDADPAIRTDEARRAWEHLYPIALEIEQAVSDVYFCAHEAASRDQLSDLDLLGRASRALHRQLVQTIEVMDPASLVDDRLGQLRHDLRTPLNSLKGYCELLLDDLGEGSLAERALLSVTRLVHNFSKGIDELMVSPVQSPELQRSLGLDVPRPSVGNPGAGRILVVEDHDESRALVVRFLQKDGHDVFEAQDGAGAMALMAEQDFDVILLDQHLPDFEGNEILINMKADTRLAAVPVIMISAGDEARQIGTSLKLGADDYVAKPIDQILLRARLAACLDRKRLRERNTAFWFDSLNKVMDLAVDGIVILTAAGDVETANPIACDIFAISADDFTKRPFGTFLGQASDWTPGQWLASDLGHAANESILREIPGFRANGAAFPLEIAIRSVENAEQPRFVAICRDATIRRAEEERMAFLARHDPATELPNRAVFIDWINEALALPDADGVLILIGVSGLRDQIEGVSLQQGTHVLRAIAMDIVRCLPSDARLASLGNDQFGVAIDFSFSNTAAELLADRIMAAVPHVVSLDGAEIDLEVWGGITRFPEDGDNPAHLIRNLELAFARARRERDRSICMFHKDMWNSYRARRTMERDLAVALELGKFELHFQPKVRISDFQMSGGEALIRWRNGDHGYVSPAEFIPVAESTGLIVPLGQFVIDETVRRIAVWIASGLKVPTIAFNASSVQFRRTDLVRILRDATLSRGVACSYLEMEITESVLLHDRVQVSRVLSQLRNLGIKIAIDDFGTGHSSLSYLAELPIDTLKIDQSFVRQLEMSGQNREIVRTVVQLAQSLGLQTVAEGVEELGQAQFLRATGCNIAQGYYFSPPVPADQFARMFARTLPLPDSVI